MNRGTKYVCQSRFDCDDLNDDDLVCRKAADPYQAKVGDQLVTSVTRPVTRGLGLGLGLGREDLLQAARTSRPLQAVPSNAVPDIPSGNSAPPNSSNDDRR